MSGICGGPQRDFTQRYTFHQARKAKASSAGLTHLTSSRLLSFTDGHWSLKSVSCWAVHVAHVVVGVQFVRRQNRFLLVVRFLHREARVTGCCYRSLFKKFIGCFEEVGVLLSSC